MNHLVLAVVCAFGFIGIIKNSECRDIKFVGSSPCEQIPHLQSRIDELESRIESLTSQMASMTVANKNIEVDSIKIGRWVIQAESDVALVIRDTVTGGDKRYAFYNGGHSDMYQAGTGGAIAATQIQFPTRWSIQEESGTYLVVRDRGVPGVDNRYAFSANRYADL